MIGELIAKKISPDNVDEMLILDSNVTVKGDITVEAPIDASEIKLEGNPISVGLVPVGSIIPWHPDITSPRPELSDEWIECNGQSGVEMIINWAGSMPMPRVVNGEPVHSVQHMHHVR